VTTAQELADDGAVRRPALTGVALQTLGTRVAVALLALANALIVARALGAEGRGDVAIVVAIADLTAILCMLGVQEANVNLAGTEPRLRRALATNSLILALVFASLGIAGVAALVAAAPGVIGEASAALLAAALVSVPFLIFNNYMRFLIQGDYGFGVTNVSWLVPPVLAVAVNGGLALAGALTVTAAVVTFVAGQLLAAAVLVWHTAMRLVGFGRPSLALARRTLGFGARSHAGRLMQTGNYRLDQWILGGIAGSRELGLYSVAVAWAEALFLLPSVLASVQRPDLVRATRAEAARLAARLFRVALLLTAVSVVGLVLLAPFLCVIVFGEEFRGSIDDLRVLALGAFGMVALKQLGNALTARQKPTLASAAIGAAFVSTVILDLVLIPEHGGLGAAIASTVSYSLGGAIVVLIFARSLGSAFRQFVPRAADVRWLWRTVSGARPTRVRSAQGAP
jgi:O-antigen/teichoic acid export membrane protein